MGRVFLTIVLPLLVPTALYVGWLYFLKWSTQGAETLRWQELPWLWLGTAGVVLLAVVLFVVTVHFGKPETGRWVPPRYEDGRVVPGYMEPPRAP
jgi:hypothetical protein